MADPTGVIAETIYRYFHILAGITWIGLLYFFNLVNLPLLKFNLKKPYDADMAEKATASIAIKTLFWFRYGALFTVIFGLLLVWAKTAQTADVAGRSAMDYFMDSGPAGYLIGGGVILGLIMAFNVWFIIWPAQQTILSNNKSIAAGVDDKGKARLQAENAPKLKNAVLASRFNTWASVPMLFGMVFGAHGGFSSEWDAFKWPLISLGIVLALMILASYRRGRPA